ncbi:MAG: hypothetical protein ACOYIC_07310 [Butyricicoccus sp.]|jgi:hypothetical protein
MWKGISAAEKYRMRLLTEETPFLTEQTAFLTSEVHREDKTREDKRKRRGARRVLMRLMEMMDDDEEIENFL